MAISSISIIVKLNLKTIEALKCFLDKVLSDAELRKQVTGSENNFTRTRKLPLPLLAGFILNMVKRSLSVEIQDFFHSLGKGSFSCTKSAFSQHRTKLLPLFFKNGIRFSLITSMKTMVSM
jgi:hypothetical protein